MKPAGFPTLALLPEGITVDTHAAYVNKDITIINCDLRQRATTFNAHRKIEKSTTESHHDCEMSRAVNGSISSIKGHRYTFARVDEYKRPIRVYIKVHDPENCMCSFMRKFEVRIQQPVGECEADMGHAETLCTQIKPGANLFNSIYFGRKGGTLRNALG